MREQSGCGGDDTCSSSRDGVGDDDSVTVVVMVIIRDCTGGDGDGYTSGESRSVSQTHYIYGAIVLAEMWYSFSILDEMRPRLQWYEKSSRREDL